MKINNQTAVQWLAKQLEDYGDPQVCELTWKELDALVERAKEIEKQQIVEAVNTFSVTGSNKVKAVLKKYNISNSGEQYYNETFK